MVKLPKKQPRSLAELIAAAKAKPGALKFGSPGVGSGAHFGILKLNLGVSSARRSPQVRPRHHATARPEPARAEPATAYS